MKKMNDNSRQVLNLYEIHEVEQIEKVKKNRTLPIIFMIIGIILIVIGLFYNNIIKIIINSNKNNKTNQTEIKDDNKLKCNYKKDDVSLGISYLYSNNYTFKDKMLKSSEQTITITPLPNSDIAADNIKVLSGKYVDAINAVIKLEGIEASSSLTNDTLKIKYQVDYKKVDLTKVPKNDKVVIDNILNEEYKSVKKKNQQNNYLCQ